MKKYSSAFLLECSLLICFIHAASAQNPIITDQFTADPSAGAFNGRVYVYPSHDILASEKRGRIGWFCMEDYHVFSSSNLTDWTDHGIIVSQYDAAWVDSGSCSMWAPDCIFRNGKYYFYFPARLINTGLSRGFGIGVAVSDNPDGPLLSDIIIPEGKGWNAVDSPVKDFQPGIHNLVVMSKDNGRVEIDRIRFFNK